MNNSSLTQSQFEPIADLQERLDALRRQYGVADRSAILYWSRVGYADDEFLVVEADGFGGALFRRGVGNYPGDFLTVQEVEYATEYDAVTAAEHFHSSITA